MVVESVLTFAAEGILSKVSSLAANKIALAWGFHTELEKLRQSLSTVQDFLGSAADQRLDDRGKVVENWVKKLKQVAEDADDVLDEFEYELLRQQVELRNLMVFPQMMFCRKVLNFLSDSNPLWFRFKMAHNIKKINDSLVELKNEAAFINLVAKKGDSRQRPDREQTDSYFEKGEKVVGREDDVTKIVTTLTSSDNQQKNLSVMAIVGMAGLGKTTLAKSVYNEPAIDKHFPKRIWVCVSNTFEVDTILSQMVDSLAPGKGGTSRDALLKVLREEITGKRYVLVLDDVWNKEREKWDSLMSCLSKLNSNPGSCIIVTTRSTNVSTIAETLPRPELRNLSKEECWSIIKQRVLNLDENGFIDAELERIGRAIAEKCGGVPLVAKVLGSLLRSRASEVAARASTVAEWSSIRDNGLWKLPEGEERIMKVLKLSFDNLEPSPLKQCFAYCSMLGKDFEIERDNLIQLWMAQGLLQTSTVENHHEMEHTGKVYFNILLNNSLFQEVIEGGSITKYTMHDLVHDLAEKVSKSERLTQESNDDVRHVARCPPSTLENMSEVTVGRLRSVFSNDQVPEIIFSKFKAMRVLSLDTADIEELPNSFGKLKHLRYLDLSKTRIKALPKSIGELYNLQTLRMQNCDLNKLPREMQNLINLRHLYVDENIEFPAGMFRGLTNLRTLSCFNVGEETGCRIEELGGLNQLKGMLTIRNLENVRDEAEAKKAKLEEKKNVVELRLVFSADSDLFFSDDSADRPTRDINDENVLEGLQPPTELESLKIKKFMGDRFPSWMMRVPLPLNNLKKLVLKGCHKCGELPILGHLPFLRDVGISGMDNLKRFGSEIYGYDLVYEATREKETIVLFPALKTLTIDGCPELIEWMEAPTTTTTTKVEVFPCLEKLMIEYCPSIGFIPIPYSMASLRELRIDSCDALSSIGQLDHCTSLQELKINSCNALSSIGLEGLSSLRELQIYSCDALSSIGLEGLSSLRELHIYSCDALSSIGLEGLSSLRELRVGSCNALSSIGQLDHCTSLQKLEIDSCDALSSIGLEGLSSLRKLQIYSCDALSSIGLEGLSSLRELWIYSCDALSSIGLEGLSSLRKLRIGNCNALSSIGQIDHCTSLQKLEINSCNALSSIGQLDHCTSLQELEIDNCNALSSIGLEGLSSLRELRIQMCDALSSIGLTSSHDLPSLRKLIIEYCDGLSALPSGIENCTSLELLDVSFCRNLATISFTRVLPSLSILQVKYCGNLSCLAVPEYCPSLQELRVIQCPKLASITVSTDLNPCLEELSIKYCDGLQSLPDFGSFTSLRELCIGRCAGIESLVSEFLQTGLSCLARLEDLGLGPFWEDLDSFPDFQVPSQQLVKLELKGWPKLKSLPQQVQHLTSLTRLDISSFKGVETLPEWLGNLASLVDLRISNCENLKYLPSLEAMQRLTKLQLLQVRGCPLLKQRCTKDSGEEWPKISHIPDIDIW